MGKNDPIEIPFVNEEYIYAWIDQKDAELARYSWHLKKTKRETGMSYAVRYVDIGGKFRHEYYLHNEVWERMTGQPVVEGHLVDHMDGDKLNNCRSNLRMATKSENEANKLKRRTHKGRGPTSKYKGVSINPRRNKKWRAHITHKDLNDGKPVFIGAFYTEEEAAKAYNKRAMDLFGQFAKLNHIEETTNDDK